MLVKITGPPEVLALARSKSRDIVWAVDPYRWFRFKEVRVVIAPPCRTQGPSLKLA